LSDNYEFPTSTLQYDHASDEFYFHVKTRKVYDHWIHEFETRRVKIQQRGTQSAHTALLRLGKRERAWRKQYIHTVANKITDCGFPHEDKMVDW